MTECLILLREHDESELMKANMRKPNVTYALYQLSLLTIAFIDGCVKHSFPWQVVCLDVRIPHHTIVACIELNKQYAPKFWLEKNLTTPAYV